MTPLPIDVCLFENPVNTVRGTMAAHMNVRGMDKTIAKTMLLTDEPARVTIIPPSRMTAEDLRVFIGTLGAFADELEARCVATEKTQVATHLSK